jgi:hypothetical protein
MEGKGSSTLPAPLPLHHTPGQAGGTPQPKGLTCNKIKHPDLVVMWVRYYQQVGQYVTANDWVPIWLRAPLLVPISHAQ